MCRAAKVKAFVRYNGRNHWGWLDGSRLGSEIEVLTGDIRDYDSVHSALDGVDVVFHLAALIGIPYSYVSPLAYIKTNVEGTYNVLQAALKLGADKVVQTSTSEVYGTARATPITEDHPLQPQSPYSATKISADNIAQSFHLSFGLPLVTARPFNTYGPRQSARAIIPTVITQIMAGRERIRLGSLHPTRDLNYVADTIGGFIALAECDAAVGRTVNISSGREISMGDLAETIKSVMGASCTIEGGHDERVRPGKSEVERLIGDNSALVDLTGWSPGHSLREGIGKTVQWFRDSGAAFSFNLLNSSLDPEPNVG